MFFKLKYSILSMCDEIVYLFYMLKFKYILILYIIFLLKYVFVNMFNLMKLDLKDRGLVGKCS